MNLFWRSDSCPRPSHCLNVSLENFSKDDGSDNENFEKVMNRNKNFARGSHFFRVRSLFAPLHDLYDVPYATFLEND